MGYQLIETIELASSASSIEFTSIPQDGVDLLLVASLRNETTQSVVFTRYNSDTATNYNHLFLQGDGSSSSSSLSTAQTQNFFGRIPSTSETSNTFGNHSLYVSNYTSLTNKSLSCDYVSENNATATNLGIGAYSYLTSSGIDSILIYAASGNFVQYSTASLYKLTAD